MLSKIKLDFSIRLITCLILCGAVFSITSCHTAKYNSSIFNKANRLPEGVDSLVVATSDSIIQYLFVDFTSKRKAEKSLEDARAALNQADSIWRKLQTMNVNSTSLTSEAVLDSSLKASKEVVQLFNEVKSNLQVAERNFLQSIRLNPFLLTSKNGLAQTYLHWANIEKAEYYYEKAATVLEEMVSVEKGEHILFYKLAECYFQLKNWQKALSHYREAEKILLATTFYADSVLHEAASSDSIKNDYHFNYLYSQAVCLARLYQAQEALAVLKKAKEKVPSLERKKIADRFEEWLIWDNGNIRAAEEKNEILELIKKEKYAEAVTRFEALEKQLSDRFAIDEIEWRIAGLEFNYLNQKPVGCKRLLKIIERNQPNSYYPSHLNATFEKYLTDCGIMHYHLGMDYIQMADYKQAQNYLEQGARLNWYGSYKCELELAKLNKHDPQISLDIVERVLQDQTDLTTSEKLIALEIKLNALRKLGPQYLNETKQIYNQIRELQKK